MNGLAWLLVNAAAQPAEHGEQAVAGHGGPAEVLIHHVVDEAHWMGLPFSKHFWFFIFAAALVVVATWLARRSYGKDRVPRGFGSAMEAMIIFVRDEIAEANIGHDGRRFTPLLLSFFFFILIAALLGLMPFSATSTGNIAVTAALATVSFFAQQCAVISNYGVIGHFKGLVPPGLPVWLLPIMIPIEIISMFTKPFALLIRLFANMLAGHMIVYSFIGMIFLFNKMLEMNFGYAAVTAVPCVAMGILISIIEAFICLLQAYIFVFLSIIFVQQSMHPAH